MTPDEIRERARRQRRRLLVLQAIVVLNAAVMAKVGDWGMVAVFVALMGVAIGLQIQVGRLFDSADEIERMIQP